MSLPLPPTLRGLPLLGNLLAYRKDHVDVFRRGYRELGPIFTMRLGTQRAVALIGPEHHRFFFEQVDNVLSLPEVYRFVIPMFGRVLNAAELPERRRHLAILRDALRGKKLKTYVELMAAETSAWLDMLGDEGEFELWEALQSLSMRIAASTLMGAEIRARIEEFVPLYEDLAGGMDFVLPPNLPLPRFRRRDRARRDLFELIQPMIAERQRNPEKYPDFLCTLAHATEADGRTLEAETIVGLSLLTLFTAYIATAAQSAWSLILLLQHPHYLNLVLRELKTVLGDDPRTLSVEALDGLERLGRALKESERLRPVFSHYARYNARSYEHGGFHVPRGYLTMICPAVAHRLPEVFSDPDRFDPERFAPDRAEDRRTPHGLIGFGGGFYRCPGMMFGTNEMKVSLSLLLGRYSLELVDPDPRPNYDIGIVRPAPPCRIRYRRRRERHVGTHRHTNVVKLVPHPQSSDRDRASA